MTITDGRPELVDEVRLSPADLRSYLGNQFPDRLNRDFLQALPGQLLPHAALQEGFGRVVAGMKELIAEG